MNTSSLPVLTFRAVLCALVLLAITPLAAQASPATEKGASLKATLRQAVESRYFPQTGRTVSGDFLRTFDRYGLTHIGLPISDESAEGSLRVQYFERARMEYHPDLAGTGMAIQLTRLGANLVPQEQTARIEAAESKGRIYFQETGHTLEGQFLQYWQEKGGLEAFGYPLTEPMWDGGLQVQWFERTRMEYHPDQAGTGWDVQLTRLGEQALAMAGGTSSLQSAEQMMQETRLLEGINAERAAVGVAPVEAYADLMDVARTRSNDMGARSYFSHYSPEGIGAFDILGGRGITYQFVGEILAMNANTSSEEAAYVALRTFLESPPHREILLDARFNHVGVGYATSAQGERYFTVIFAQR